MPTNTELVDRLAAACAWDPFEFEFSHKAEHSIEFQALMLSYVYGPTVKIVPILTSDFGEDGEFLDEGEDGSLHKFLNECRAIVNEANGKISVVASVDLAHVGRCFGDDFDIDEDVVASVEDRDREDLENVLNIDPAAFYRSVQRDNNLRNVCGVNAIYSGLYTLQDSVQSAEILHYDFARDPADGIVSFTSIALR